jgi:ABC-type ATPase with predicted acetyltransferase domain
MNYPLNHSLVEELTAEQMVDTSQGNIDENKLTEKQVIARAKVLAATEGKGDNSRPGLFILCVEAARKRAINKDSVATIFHEYSLAAAAARGVGWKRQDSEKQQMSKLAVSVRLGELPHVDGPALMNKVIAFQKAEREANDGKMDYSPFDGMVKVARYQVNESPGAMLTDDVIKGLLIKPAKDLPEEADILERHVKAMTSTIDAKKPEAAVSEESREALRDAIAVLMTRISELGGSTADRKRQAKLEQQAEELTALAATARARLAGVEVRTV